MRTRHDSRYETFIVGLMFLTWGTVFLDRMAELYLAPFIAKDFHLNAGQIGELASILAITWAFSSFVLGAVSDRVGRKPVLVPAVFAFAGLSWLCGAARNFFDMLLLRGAIGVAEGPCWSIVNTLVEKGSHPKRRGRNTGIVVSAAALIGFAVAPVLTTQIASRFGWRWAFVVAGAPGVILAVVIWLFVREPRDKTPEQASEAPVAKPGVRDFLALLKYRNIQLAAIGNCGFVAWLILYNTFCPLYIVHVAGEPATTAGFLMGAAGLGSFFIGCLVATVSDVIGRRATLLISGPLCTVLPLILLWPPMYAHLWLLAAVLFVSQAGQAVAAIVMVLVPTETAPPTMAAAAIGIVTLFGEIVGGAIAPTAAGEMADSFPSLGLAIPLLMAAAGSMLVFVVALFMRETADVKNQVARDPAAA
ncbi:MFS transporter [Salinisphaera hydrothermalis]|uniref:Major facilitator superfamily protein n=1 Tax=Salinisphaera hydrothermalis (strain C41B8) TaxID=1304275 RepID=A0A084IPK0_SALHC|nr:MFS transporter [Salinisphaera hydrothermalis]KEZ78634.1 major facilitator superfamily protein [Salinisphaera hydrothermalis C41B8]